LERREGALGCMASALVLMDLIEARVALAAPGQVKLLGPVMDDIQHARRLIRHAQLLAGPSARPEDD